MAAQGPSQSPSRIQVQPQPRPSPNPSNDHKDHADGLKQFEKNMGDSVSNIQTTIETLGKTLNESFKFYTDAIDERKHLLYDIDGMIKNNPEAAKKLAELEQKLKQSEDAKQEALKKQQEAERQKALLDKQMSELQKSQQMAEERARTLEEQNKQLQSLQQSQTAMIATNIQTLAELRKHLNDLNENIRKLDHQASAYGCIKLYIKFPLLLKLRKWVLDNSQQTWYTNIKNTQDFSTAYNIFNGQIDTVFATEKKNIQEILDRIQSANPNVKQPDSYFTTLMKKYEDVKRFINSSPSIQPPISTITWGKYLLFQWMTENQNSPLLTSKEVSGIKELVDSISQKIDVYLMQSPT